MTLGAPAQPDTALMKDRIIKWLRANKNIFDITNPEGSPIITPDTNPSTVTAKFTTIIFGVPEEEHWQNVAAPFLSISNSDNFITSDQFFGSVVNNALTSSYEKYQFDIVIVVQASDAETTERMIDYLIAQVRQTIKSNVTLQDTDASGNLIPGTDLCATTRTGNVSTLPSPVLNRRLFAFIFPVEVEVNA